MTRRASSETQPKRPSVLIVSDDTEFGRVVVARWQTEHYVPEITLLSSDIWSPATLASYDLVMMGCVRDSYLPAILAALSLQPAKPVICLAEKQEDAATLQGIHPYLLIVTRQDGWANALILLAAEILRRIDALSRAHRAERLALESQNHATLGRYMLDMRPSINNALTSVLGNADLLLAAAEDVNASREQIQTIQSMALRLNEIMQRFSSLACEMRINEKESRIETAASVS